MGITEASPNIAIQQIKAERIVRVPPRFWDNPGRLFGRMKNVDWTKNIIM